MFPSFGMIFQGNSRGLAVGLEQNHLGLSCKVKRPILALMPVTAQIGEKSHVQAEDRKNFWEYVVV